MSTQHRLGILLSGRGSNFLAIANSLAAGRIPNAEIAVVISNRADAPGLAAARERGLEAIAIEANGRKRAEHMRLLSPEFIQAFPQRILNIHPSLLPAFPGLDAQHQAFEYGVKIAGCTVHFVDEQLDHGVIVLQRTVPVLETDDAGTLSARILAQEHIAYTEAIVRVLSGEYVVRGRRYVQLPLQG